jgi:hypothetical protein
MAHGGHQAIHFLPLFYSGPPDKPSIEGFPENGKAEIGSNVTFTCKRSGSVRVTSFEWLNNSQLLASSGEKNAVYTIEGVTEADVGNYTCQAVNQAGKTTGENRTLKVFGK